MLLVLAACSSTDSGSAFEPEATLTPDVQTQIAVKLRTQDAQEVQVEFGETGDYGFITPATVGAEHRHLLRGMASNVDVHWRVLIDGEAGEDHVTATGLLPPELPIPEVRYDDATWDGFLVVPMVGAWQGIVILDSHGRVVWYYEPPTEGKAAVRAAPLLNGRGLSFNLKAYDGDAHSTLETVSWEAASLHSIDVPRIAHDYLEISEETFAVLQEETQEVDGESFVGEHIAELGMDGVQTAVWSAFDSWDPLTVGANTPAGWTHANALDWDPDRGEYQVGFREFNTIVRISRETGELTASMGGAANDGWTFLETDRPFGYQHQFTLTDTQLLVFDNGLPEDDSSRVVEYAVDEAAKTLTEVWSYSFDPPQWVYALGDTERLDDGSTLIAWGVGGRMQQVSPEGETLWQIETPVGDGFGYVTHVDSLY